MWQCRGASIASRAMTFHDIPVILPLSMIESHHMPIKYTHKMDGHYPIMVEPLQNYTQPLLGLGLQPLLVV